MTFWNSLSEEGKDALIAAAIMIPALILTGIIGVATDLTAYDILRWLLT